jgi:hypothetical protein
MTVSKYPNGFRDGVSIQNMPVLNTYGNKVFWVYYDTTNSTGGSDGNPGTFEKPFASLDYAVGQCTASRGDIIMLKPNHNETISSATALALDVAGITILGLGRGSTRPKFILDTATTSTIAVSAASISIENVIFSANFADIAELFTPTATDFACIDCKFTQEAVNMNFVEIADTGTTNNEVDGLTFVGCEWVEVDTASTSLVNVDADIEGLTVQDCYIDLGVNGVLSAIAEVAAGKDLTNVDIRRNYVSRLVTASAVQLITFVDTTTTNTGIMEDNRCRSLDVAGELLLTAGTNISLYNNLSTSAVDASGYVLPAIDA